MSSKSLQAENLTFFCQGPYKKCRSECNKTPFQVKNHFFLGSPVRWEGLPQSPHPTPNKPGSILHASPRIPARFTPLVVSVDRRRLGIHNFITASSADHRTACRTRKLKLNNNKIRQSLTIKWKCQTERCRANMATQCSVEIKLSLLVQVGLIEKQISKTHCPFLD